MFGDVKLGISDSKLFLNSYQQSNIVSILFSQIKNTYSIQYVRLWANFNHCSLELKLRDPTSDVLCISTNIQDGEQLSNFNRNI